MEMATVLRKTDERLTDREVDAYVDKVHNRR